MKSFIIEFYVMWLCFLFYYKYILRMVTSYNFTKYFNYKNILFMMVFNYFLYDLNIDLYLGFNKVT